MEPEHQKKTLINLTKVEGQKSYSKTHFVDGNRPHEGKNDRPPLPNREVSRTWSFSAEFEPAGSKDGSGFTKSQVHDKSVNVNEVNIKSQLSHEPIASSYPSNPSDIKEPRQPRALDFASKGDVSQKIAGESSEEFDDNSVDTASAATLKKAIEQAQESIRIAKMIMERKKDGQDGSDRILVFPAFLHLSPSSLCERIKGRVKQSYSVKPSFFSPLPAVFVRPTNLSSFGAGPSLGAALEDGGAAGAAEVA